MLNIHIQNIITDAVEYSDNKGLLLRLTASRITLQLIDSHGEIGTIKNLPVYILDYFIHYML